MDIKEMRQKMARLESVNDMLKAELDALNTLMVSIGFPEGIITVREAAQEILSFDDFNES